MRRLRKRPDRLNTILTVLLVMLALAGALGSAWAEPGAREEWETGRLAQLSGDHYTAVEHFKKSLRINPAYVEPMIGLAESFAELEIYDEALRYVLMARRHDRRNRELLNLEGRIRTAMGELEEARVLFEQVLEKEPNNVGARLGLAKVDLAGGRKRQAAKQYEEILDAVPRDVDALLELVLLYVDLGEEVPAARYLEVALRYHGENPRVYYTAGRYHMRRGELETAAGHLSTALDLRPEYPEARQLLGEVHLSRGRPSEAAAVLEQNLGARNADHVHSARYALGAAYAAMGSVEDALDVLDAALRSRPYDEVTRLAAESTALSYYDQTQRWRRKYARYRLEEGRRLDRRSFLRKALAEYRRAVQLDRASEDARLALAQAYRQLGFPLKYLAELIVLRDYYGSVRTEVEDDIEILEHRRLESVAADWVRDVPALRGSDGIVDQYGVDKRAYTIDVYTIPQDNDLVHIRADVDFTDYLRWLVYGSDKFAPPEAVAERGAAGSSGKPSFERAFEQARSSGTDYFVIAAYEETERSVRVDALLYLTRTGALLERFSVFRTGNRMLQEALLRMSVEIGESLPASGTVAARDFDRGLINLGSYNGIRKGDVFLIIRKGELTYTSDRIGFRFDEADILGRFTVTATDEAVAEGVIQPVTFFDRINVGDEVIPAGSASETDSNPSSG